MKAQGEKGVTQHVDPPVGAMLYQGGSCGAGERGEIPEASSGRREGPGAGGEWEAGHGAHLEQRGGGGGIVSDLCATAFVREQELRFSELARALPA